MVNYNDPIETGNSAPQRFHWKFWVQPFVKCKQNNSSRIHARRLHGWYQSSGEKDIILNMITFSPTKPIILVGAVPMIGISNPNRRGPSNWLISIQVYVEE